MKESRNFKIFYSSIDFFFLFKFWNWEKEPPFPIPLFVSWKLGKSECKLSLGFYVILELDKDMENSWLADKKIWVFLLYLNWKEKGNHTSNKPNCCVKINRINPFFPSIEDLKNLIFSVSTFFLGTKEGFSFLFVISFMYLLFVACCKKFSFCSLMFGD